MSRGEDWHQASTGGIAAKNNPQLKLIKADLSKAWPCTISTCLVLLVGEVNPQHAHSLKYKLYRGQQVVQHCRLWVDSSCYWNMQLHGENVLWLLLSTLKLMSSCLEKPWLWIILICLIRVLFPLSAGPDTNQFKTGDRVSKKKTKTASGRGCTYRAWGFSPHSSLPWHAHRGPALFWSSGVLPVYSPQWHPGGGTFPYRSEERFRFRSHL